MDMPSKIARDERRPSSFDKIPVEIIESILKFVRSSKDVLNFALTSKACYDTALALVYQNVDWVVGSAYAERRDAALRSVEFLRKHPDILPATRVLRLSERKFDLGGDTKLFLDHLRNEVPVQPFRKEVNWHGMSVHARSFPETFHATNIVLQILPQFSGLTELTLRSITLPRTFYQSIHALSSLQLRRVTLRYCRLTTRYPAGYDSAHLQLTELSIFSAFGRIPKLKSLLKLARSPTLRILRLDRSIERALGSLIAYGLPPSVHSLELDWRVTSHVVRQSYGSLFFFLNNCKFVRHLELTEMGKLEPFDSYPRHRRLQPNAMPSLTSIAVPVTYLHLLLRGRAIDSVTITDTTLRDTTSMSPMLKFLTLDEIAEVLKILQLTSISLRSLRFNLRCWDKELFYMLARKQRKLKELHVAYQYGDVDDAFFMTLGNLIEFPDLEILHLYRFGDNMAGTEDSRFIDQKEYVIIWQLYMPNLREVALCPDIIWTRSPALPNACHGHKVKRTWSCYSVEPMEGVEGLIVVACPKEARKYEALGRERRNYRQHGLPVNTHNHNVVHLLNAEEDVIMEDIPDDIEDQDFH